MLGLQVDVKFSFGSDVGMAAGISLAGFFTGDLADSGHIFV